MKKSLFLGLCFIGLIGASVAGAESKYNLNRASMSGACHIQISTSSPQLGNLIEAFGTQKKACEKAKKLHDDDVTETKKCFEYTKGARKLCKKEGVNLP